MPSASSNSQTPGSPSTPPQSIPLRDLTRPPDSADLGDGVGRHSRGRSLLSGGQNHGPRYERLGESSPSPTERVSFRTHLSRLQTAPSSKEPDSISPGGDFGGDLQVAMGFAGLRVPDISISRPTQEMPAPYGAEDFDHDSPYYDGGGDDSRANISTEADNVPLTDPRQMQPLSGAPSFEDGQGHHRSSFHNVSFSLPGPNHWGARLGDELQTPETRPLPSKTPGYGDVLGPNAKMRSRSPSTSTAFSRAGSMVRAMSQRVVNLSGEAEVIEESARREASLQSARKASRGSRGSRRSRENPREEDAESDLSSLDEESEPQLRRKADPLGPGPNYRGQNSTTQAEKSKRLFSGINLEASRESGMPGPSSNPLKGKSLGIFSAESRIRNTLCDVLVYPFTEPAILLLIMVQTVLLTIRGSTDDYAPGNNGQSGWSSKPIDLALLVLFIIFTLEIIARIIVSGFIFNAPEYSNRTGTRTLREIVVDNYRAIFAPQRRPSLRASKVATSFGAPELIRPFTSIQGDGIHSVEQAQRHQLSRRAFLRHSFNRLDLIAVVSFWVSFVLSFTGIEGSYHLYIFRMMSSLRILRLLALTNGTSIILRSLKKAAPLLVNVSFLICFFWLLFAIIGVQSFKSSFDRQCVWIDPSDPFNTTGSAYVNVLQMCGGQLNNLTGAHDPWKTGDLTNLKDGASSAKGFLCPQGSICLQLESNHLPYNGTVTFDNILNSLELVFVIMTANTYSDLMYYTLNSDYLAAALFFAGGIIIMTLWLLNLLIAVITSSFQVIREEGKRSAFAATVKGMVDNLDIKRPKQLSTIKRLYNKSHWFWIIVIAYGLMCQAFRTAHMSQSGSHFLETSEGVVTILLLIDIILRFITDWRGFPRDKKNWIDLGLAVITAIILIPPIKNSGQPYAWLTVFQILRTYRVIIAVPVTKSLITLVLGNSSGIGNLVLFVFLMTFLMSIFAVQLFRGELPKTDPYGNVIRVTFFNVYNAFLGMYQILSSENWTTILYGITSFDTSRNTAWIGAVFFISWFILGNFILVNMFIAVIQETFDVSEDEKRMHQVKSFLNRKELGGSASNLSLSAIFRLGRSRTKKDPLDYGPATMEMLLKDAVVRDFLDDEAMDTQEPEPPTPAITVDVPEVKSGFLPSLWHRFKTRIWNREPNPFYSNIRFSAADDTDARAMAKEAVTQTSQRKKAQREYLARHPGYNNALLIFKPNNPIRRLCQKIVGPGRGSERFDGVEPNRVVWYAFSAFIYAAIVAMVLLACVTTPLYQKEYFDRHEFSVKNWFVWSDMAFALVFTVEAAIKVIADGFYWTPNAYFRSSWGAIDFIVLVTFWINVITSLLNDGAVSRAIGAFKALRALRLLNVSDSARDTFHSLIIVGGWKVFSAAFVSLSLLIPFAIYGVNLFNGQMEMCNDNQSGITNLSDCFGEWNSTPFSNNWNVTAPRVVANPYYNFDSFPSSLLILFQIVSQEGWVDVMWSAESIVGRGLQPQFFASQGNAIFFVIFNLLGTVFVLTLFISVFMRNYTEQTGVAFLTSDQRSWLELRKLLRQVSPSKRPTNPDRKRWRDWCYKRAVRKHGRWQRAMTIILVLHLILLMVEYYNEPAWWDTLRTYIFLGFIMFYMVNVFVRIIGLGWSRFSRSSWDVFSVFAVFGSFIFTILHLAKPTAQSLVQVQKTFLVLIVLLVIPRNDALDQLFKTAAASLPNIGNLLATWSVLFLVFAIAMTQTFGLTRFGSQETGNINFRNVPKALILLFRMSTGEGWNQIMEDFAHIEPPFCVNNKNFFQSDCGSLSWARALFISWNILSMYIFTSLFVSLIYESFSYVYQHSSGLGKVSREEIRRFKQAWATLDPEGTGFITKEQFPRLLGELSGVFEMRIYSQEHSVRKILEDIQSDPAANRRMTSMTSASGAGGVDLQALNSRLAQIDPKVVRKARVRHNLFFEEVMVSADVDRGISFTTVLMILAHYNVISDNKSLKLEEFLRRRARLQRVEEEVRRRIVLGFFDTMYWSRRFRKHMDRKKAQRMTDIPQLGPAFVDDEYDIAQQAQPAPSPFLAPLETEDPRQAFISHGWGGRRRQGAETSIVGTPISFMGTGLSSKPSPEPSHKTSNSAFSFDPDEIQEMEEASGQHHRGGSTAENVLNVLDNSAWGASIRRSFTVRRPSAGESP